MRVSSCSLRSLERRSATRRTLPNRPLCPGLGSSAASALGNLSLQYAYAERLQEVTCIRTASCHDEKTKHPALYRMPGESLGLLPIKNRSCYVTHPVCLPAA
jgi:hypothetical protein